MAIINTGAVERTITGVNESDLFLDESSSSVTNTGVVEREIEGKHDANFVHPLGDELIVDTVSISARQSGPKAKGRATICIHPLFFSIIACFIVLELYDQESVFFQHCRPGFLCPVALYKFEKPAM